MKDDGLRPEDLAQECNAYMEIKHFMSQRILEQEEEMEQLKTNLLYHSGKHIEMYDWIKNINENLNSLNIRKDSGLNFSGDIIDSINCDDNNINNFNNSELLLKNENLDLIKQNEALRTEIATKNLQISKLSSEKLMLINELIELMISLKRVNLNSLNKFFMENSEEVKDRIQITSALGLKYNILSAQHQISCLVKGDSKSLEHKLERGFDVLKHFSDDLKKSLDKNLKKTKILDL